MADPLDRPALPRADADEESRPLPVLAESRPLDRPAPPPLPAVIAAGTVGFLAGVAAWVLLRVIRRPRGGSAVRRLQRRRARGLEVLGTRSFLVDVHLIKRP